MVRARKRRLRTSVLKSLASSASPFGSLLLPSGDINDEVMLTRRRAQHAAVMSCGTAGDISVTRMLLCRFAGTAGGQ